jgi:hypothetical protein
VERLEQRIKSLQVIITMLCASSVGLAVGLATSVTGATTQVSLSSAIGVFFAVVMASMAILTYMRR